MPCAVIVVQLVEQSLLTQEICSSNPNHGKFFMNSHFFWKNEKEAGKEPNKQLILMAHSSDPFRHIFIYFFV